MSDKKSLIHTMRYPPQQHKLSPGKQWSIPRPRESPGTIIAIDDVTGTLRLRRGPSLRDVPLPRAIAPGGPYDTPAQRAALARFASSVAEDDGHYSALRDILARTPPRIVGRASEA